MHVLLFSDMHEMGFKFLKYSNNVDSDYCKDNVLPIDNCLNSGIENILTDFQDIEFRLA